MAVRHPGRHAALLRALRADPEMRLVGSEAEADVVLRDAQAEPVPLRATAGEELTVRELEVLQLLAEGRGNRAIAAVLGIAPSTVKHHLAAIYMKLDVGNRTEAVREGMRRGWVTI